jgi:hypothetical protein
VAWIRFYDIAILAVMITTGIPAEPFTDFGLLVVGFSAPFDDLVAEAGRLRVVLPAGPLDVLDRLFELVGRVPILLRAFGFTRGIGNAPGSIAPSLNAAPPPAGSSPASSVARIGWAVGPATHRTGAHGEISGHIRHTALRHEARDRR